jgi:hypothetical protein
MFNYLYLYHNALFDIFNEIIFYYIINIQKMYKLNIIIFSLIFFIFIYSFYLYNLMFSDKFRSF